MMKINKDKHIGRVLFIVEGSRNEFNLIRKIFCDILKYEYIEKRRNRPDTFKSKNDSHSTIAVINTRESNIKDISDHTEYLDAVFELLLNKYQFPVNKSAIYYLFDRDPESNTDAEMISSYIETLNNPYENDTGFHAGQLLLSYPSIEAYTISNFCTGSFNLRFHLGSEAKHFISENRKIQLNKISEDTLANAAIEFAEFLNAEGITWDIDDFRSSCHEIFNLQEKEYLIGSGFKIFSMLTLAFLQLGIIELN